MPKLISMLLMMGVAFCDSDAIPDLCTTLPGSPCDSLCRANTVIKYNKIDSFPLCFEIMSLLDDNTTDTSTETIHGRSLFFPEVDRFAMFTMNWTESEASSSGFNPLVPSSNGIGRIRAYSTGVTSDMSSPNMIQSANSTLFSQISPSVKSSVVPLYLTLLVHMNLGRPTSLTWEYGDCSGCADDECLYGKVCGVVVGQQGSTATECGAHCRPKIYVAFAGTDGNGHILTSSGSMLTRFSSYGLEKTYKSIRGAV